MQQYIFMASYGFTCYTFNVVSCCKTFLITCKHQKYTYEEGFTQTSQYMQVRKTCIIDMYTTNR